MVASFPGAIYSTPSRDDADMSAATTHEDHHDQLVEEVRAIETEFGLTPSGPFSTVADRLKPIGALCQLVQTSTQSITNNLVTAATFTAEDLDPLSWHSTSVNTDRVTPTIAGWYRVTFNAAWGTDTDYTRLLMGPTKNGSGISTPEMRIDSIEPAVSGARQFTASTPLISANGSTDYFGLNVFQTNTSAAANTVQCRLLVELVYPS